LQQNLDIIKHEERIRSGENCIISAIDVFKTYDAAIKTQAASGVTFGVKQGETLGLLGPNGAGKSTIFSVISMQEPRSYG
jgi:ABC-type multidrug transport system ATPase subunit